METVKNNIYLGSRGEDFRQLIQNLLDKADLKPKYKNLLLDEKSMRIYGAAFTTKDVDPKNNYEIYEQLGDLSANKFIVGYMYRRFPQLKCASGVKVVARLRINYGAKESFAGIARDLGFWNFISATTEDREKRMKPLLEDTLEAFFGATEDLLDNRLYMGVGYPIVYSILKSIFDKITISLKYEDLYDPKTRLKELFDFKKDQLGVVEYIEKEREPGDMFTVSRVYSVTGGTGKTKLHGGRWTLIGEGRGSLQKVAQQAAATQALEHLKRYGIFKPIPKEYMLFCDHTV